MLQGFTPPYTPQGLSSLVTAPPWHYAGQMLSLRYAIDPSVAATYLPKVLGRPTGQGYVHVCEWQSCSEGWELRDPVYAQYREFFVMIEAKRGDDTLSVYCPLIWVDQDIAMLRGLLQGWPKKMGSIAMTRSYNLDHPAAAAPRDGTKIGASLAAKDRRIAELVATLHDAPGAVMGVLAHPAINYAGLPDLEAGAAPTNPRLLRARVRDVRLGPMVRGTAEVRFLGNPREELLSLAPQGSVEASFGFVALSIDGAAAA